MGNWRLYIPESVPTRFLLRYEPPWLLPKYGPQDLRVVRGVYVTVV
jgi:hypothetical protein